MSLTDKKSMYDLQAPETNAVAHGFEGENWATSGPSTSDFEWFANGMSGWTQSPFVSSTGDHMVDLMTEDIVSNNHYPAAITYFKSPTNSDYQDLNTSAEPGAYSGQTSNSLLGQFGGPYVANCPPGGFC